MKKIILSVLFFISLFFVSCIEPESYKNNFDENSYNSNFTSWNNSSLKSYSFTYELLTSSEASLWGIKANVSVINGQENIEFLNSENEIISVNIEAGDERYLSSIDKVFSYIKKYSKIFSDQSKYSSLNMVFQSYNTTYHFPENIYGRAYMKNTSDKIGKSDAAFGVRVTNFSVIE